MHIDVACAALSDNLRAEILAPYIMSFTNLIRFKDHSGRVLYGDVPDESLNNLIGASAAVLKGHPLEGDLTATSEKAIVKEVSAATPQPTSS